MARWSVNHQRLVGKPTAFCLHSQKAPGARSSVNRRRDNPLAPASGSSMPKPHCKARNAAFHRQGGRCYYCEFPMWLADRCGFAATHGLTLRQASRLQATGEHLVAQQDGGKHGANVVAACHHCNNLRHRFRQHSAPDPVTYRLQVQQRVRQRHWHSHEMFRVLSNGAH